MLESNLRRDLTTPNTGAVEAARERFAPPLPISPRAARVLFVLIQLGYLIMYAAFFQRFQEAMHESARFYPPRFWGLWLSIVATCGLAVSRLGFSCWPTVASRTRLHAAAIAALSRRARFEVVFMLSPGCLL